MLTKRRLLIVFVFLSIIILFIFNDYRNSFQTVVVYSKESFTLKFYPIINENEGVSIGKNVVFETNKPGSYRIKKGSYRYILSKNSPSYVDIKKDIDISRKREVIVVGNFTLTDEKLAEMLENEITGINKTIYSAYPVPMQGYTIQLPRLYFEGQWFGAVLMPNDTEKQDTYRIVLKKKDGKWEVATKPPSILLAKQVFPDIPFDVLSDLNGKGFPKN